VWNRWRQETPHTIPFLQSAELSGIDLTSADLTNADCEFANLRGAVLQKVRGYQAEFFQADLRDADLRDSDLQGAKFHTSDLRNADLRSTDLFRADFIGTLLDGADLSGARCLTTAFSDVDLTKVLGLESVRHSGPSNIDISTLLKSNGEPAATFFRLAGVPENVLGYLKALVEPSIHFYSVFISYSTSDQRFASRLYDDLRQAGVRCWFAPHDIRGGEKIHAQIDQAIRIYDRLLLILSDASMNSEWVKTEIANARQREIREKRQMLFPISLVPFEGSYPKSVTALEVL
jgi:hypothetical protein